MSGPRTLPVTITDGVTDMNAASVMDNMNYLQGKFPLQQEITFFIPGNLAVADSQVFHYVFGRYVEIYSIYAQVKTAPTTQSIIIEPNKNTTPLGTLSITATNNYAQGDYSADSNRNFNNTDYLRFDINQVGSGTVGADLTIVVRFRVHGANDTGP
jgi:hypothetical protein